MEELLLFYNYFNKLSQLFQLINDF